MKQKQPHAKIESEVQRLADKLREITASDGSCTREQLVSHGFTPEFINNYNEIAVGIANEDAAKRQAA